jgi:hypothetical protein
MGLFDTVKLKANALAADAERAGKVTAAQARTVVLQNDIRKAERELGHSTFSLIESGAIAHPDLESAAARLRAARQVLTDKETEIAGLRGHAAEAAATAAPAPADEEAGPAMQRAEAGAPEEDAAIIKAPPAAETAAPVEAAAGAAKKPAAKKPAAMKPATAKKPAAKKPEAKKAAAKKSQAAGA